MSAVVALAQDGGARRGREDSELAPFLAHCCRRRRIKHAIVKTSNKKQISA